MLNYPLACLAIAIFFNFTALTPFANADEITAPNSAQTICPTPRQRPCIALVLGGGGARGSAHIGVLKALEERHIPIDLIVGTSIGSFVGGLYATGKSADDIQTLFSQANWKGGYRDNINRAETPNRRKRQQDEFPIQLDLGIDKNGIKLPKGFLRGQGMKYLVDSMLGSYPTFSSFNNLAIPFRAVAADAVTGDAVILSSGDLATALQISMSLPGVLRPIEQNGRLLVDGGIANNLPINVARALGAGIIIAVDIGSPPLTQQELDSGFTILRQLTSFLTRVNVDHQKQILTPQDILLQPDIHGVTTLSFDNTLDAVAAGYREANQQFDNHPELTKLAKAAQQATTLKNSPSAANNSLNKNIVVDNIQLINHTRLADDYLLHRMQLKEGNAYSPEDIYQGTNKLYGQGTIARINHSLEQNNTQNTLHINAEEKEWGPGYLDFKIAFEDDFDSFSHYQLGGSYRLTNLSPYGAEWYSTGEFGTEKKLSTTLYWPFLNSGFFGELNATYRRSINEIPQTNEGKNQIILSEYASNLGIGWNAIDPLDITLGVLNNYGNAELPTNLAAIFGSKHISFQQQGIDLRLNFDTLDNASLPKHGWKFDANLIRAKDKVLTLEEYFTQIDLKLNIVYSLGRHTLRNQLRYQSTLHESPNSFLGSFEMGGFLNLSGTVADSLSGQHTRFGSMVYTYELVENNFGAIKLPLFLGLSAERGNVWDTEEEIDLDDMINSNSAFIGWNSPIGPAYLAYGKSSTGESSMYIFVGIVF